VVAAFHKTQPDRLIRAALIGPGDPVYGELELLAKGNGEADSVLARYLLRGDEPPPEHQIVLDGSWREMLTRCSEVTRSFPLDPLSPRLEEWARIGGWQPSIPRSVEALEERFGEGEEPRSCLGPWVFAAKCEAARIAQLVDSQQLRLLVPSPGTFFRAATPAGPETRRRKQRQVVWHGVHRAVTARLVDLGPDQMQSFFDQWGLVLVDEGWVSEDQDLVDELASVLRLNPCDNEHCRRRRWWFWRSVEHDRRIEPELQMVAARS